MKYVCLTFKQITWYGVFFQFHQMSSLVYLNINFCLAFCPCCFWYYYYCAFCYKNVHHDGFLHRVKPCLESWIDRILTNDEREVQMTKVTHARVYNWVQVTIESAPQTRLCVWITCTLYYLHKQVLTQQIWGRPNTCTCDRLLGGDYLCADRSLSDSVQNHSVQVGLCLLWRNSKHI